MKTDPQIIIVDDSPISLALVTSQLQSGGYRNIRTATSSEEAQRLLGIEDGTGSPEPVDLILLDILMGKKGWH